MLVNAGKMFQRLAGLKVQLGCKQEGPRNRGPFCFSRFILEGLAKFGTRGVGHGSPHRPPQRLSAANEGIALQFGKSKTGRDLHRGQAVKVPVRDEKRMRVRIEEGARQDTTKCRRHRT